MYNADNIQIKKYAVEPWEMAISLAEKYPLKNPKLIMRGLEACQLAGVEYSYYINKYLKGLPVAENKDVTTIYKGLMYAAIENKAGLSNVIV